MNVPPSLRSEASPEGSTQFSASCVVITTPPKGRQVAEAHSVYQVSIFMAQNDWLKSEPFDVG